MNNIELKEFRRKYRLTQSALAEKLGVDVKTVQNWEAGKKIPATKNGILRALEINLSTSDLAVESITNTDGVLQNNQHGDNIQGDRLTIYKVNAEFIELLKKKDEQIDRLLSLLEKK